MEDKIKFDGTGDGVTDKGIHFVDPVQDYTLCGATLDGDPATAGGYISTQEKVDCSICIGIIEYCKKIKKSEYKNK